MVCSTAFWATVIAATLPWQAEHSILARMCGACRELDVCSAFEAVHPLPGHLTFLVPILDQQLYSGSFVGDPLVAQHALVDRRDRRRGTYVSSAVAVDAVDTRRHVFIVRELDRLLLAPKAARWPQQRKRLPAGGSMRALVVAQPASSVSVRYALQYFRCS